MRRYTSNTWLCFSVGELAHSVTYMQRGMRIMAVRDWWPPRLRQQLFRQTLLAFFVCNFYRSFLSCCLHEQILELISAWKPEHWLTICLSAESWSKNFFFLKIYIFWQSMIKCWCIWWGKEGEKSVLRLKQHSMRTPWTSSCLLWYHLFKFWVIKACPGRDYSGLGLFLLMYTVISLALTAACGFCCME